MKTIVRLGAAMVMAVALVIGVAGTASAAYDFEVEFHVRACGPDAVDVYADCHDNPVEGYAVKGWGLGGLEQFETCETDADGNCYYSVDDGSVELLEVDYEVGELIAVYCSSDSDNVEIYEAGDMYLQWRILAPDIDSLVVCDLYIYDEDAGADDGAALPDTGAGMSGRGANLGLLLAGVVALGGLAVASRRPAVR